MRIVDGKGQGCRLLLVGRVERRQGQGRSIRRQTKFQRIRSFQGECCFEVIPTGILGVGVDELW